MREEFWMNKLEEKPTCLLIYSTHRRRAIQILENSFEAHQMKKKAREMSKDKARICLFTKKCLREKISAWMSERYENMIRIEAQVLVIALVLVSVLASVFAIV